MRWRPGPSGLLRLAAVTTLGLSLLLAGCAASTHDAPQAASAKEAGAWTRCDRDHPVAITVICFQR